MLAAAAATQCGWHGCSKASCLFPSHHSLLPPRHRCRCCTEALFVLAASPGWSCASSAAWGGGEDGAQRHRDGCTERWPLGPSKATCEPVRSSLSASHQSARRLINFLFVFQSFIFKLQSSLLSNKYSTIKAFFSPTCDSNISVSHPPVTFPAINRFVKTAFDAPAAISHLKSHNYHPIMGLLTSSKNKAIEYGNLFVN